MKTPSPHRSPFLAVVSAATLLSLVSLSAAVPSESLPGTPPHSNPSTPDAPIPSRPAEEFKSPNTPPSRATERVLSNVSIWSSEAVRLSDIASDRAASSEVRSFADQVASACRALSQEVNQNANNKNVIVPTGRDANETAEESERWNKKDAGEFDNDYIKRTVRIHRDTITAFEDYIGNKDADPEISAVAQKHLPSLRENLRQAESLHAQGDR